MKLIVIVEDDAPMRKSLERLLQTHNYATSAFASAEEFLQSGIADTASGAVFDVHLPGMSGIELHRHLLVAGCRFPVAFMTAFDDEATRAEARAAGCIEYLEKPFDASRLLEALESANEM